MTRVPIPAAIARGVLRIIRICGASTFGGSANSDRTYGEADVRRLRMVAAARALDLPREDVRDLSHLVSAGRQPCARLRSIAEQRRGMVRRMIQELRNLEERLTDTIALSSAATNTTSVETHSGCPILEASATEQT